LLISVPREKQKQLLEGLNSRGVSGAKLIGHIIEDEKCRIQVRK
jgi:hypothetical protein